jgi:hypothetical protein
LVSLKSSVRAPRSPPFGGEAAGFGAPVDAWFPARLAPAGAQGSDSNPRIAAESATFVFDGAREAGQAELAAARQAEFEQDFRRDLERLHRWAAENEWPALAAPALHVTVSHKYRISKSLVPAWYGRAGEMQFPAWRVAAREAAIAHELVHVFWPNGNRFLAEGLAIHLQAALGGNPAFPNFDRPLHEVAVERMQAMRPENGPDGGGRFGHISLSELDAVATPNPLVLKVGAQFYGEDARGQAQVYPLAGSFVQFLVEAGGLERFRALYGLTPLAPHELNGGAPDRWIGVYGRALADLEAEWKAMLGHRHPVAGSSSSS